MRIICRFAYLIFFSHNQVTQFELDDRLIVKFMIHVGTIAFLFFLSSVLFFVFTVVS